MSQYKTEFHAANKWSKNWRKMMSTTRVSHSNLVRLLIEKTEKLHAD